MPIKTTGEMYCTRCRSKSQVDIQLTFDSINDGSQCFPIVKCPLCNNQNKVHVPFIYWDRDPNTVYYVFPTQNLNAFQNTLKSLNLIYQDFIMGLDFSDQKLIKSAAIKYTETKLFTAVVNHFEPNDFCLGVRNLRFTPELTVRVSDEITFQSPEKDLPLLKNEVAFYEDGQSELNKEIIAETKKIIDKQNLALNIKAVKEEQHPTETLGVAEFFMFIGSSVVLPIILNVLSNAISNFLFKKKISNDDKLKIKIKENKTKNLYYLEGKSESVIAALDKFSKDTVNTLTVPGNCHVTTITDNVVAEPNFNGLKTLDNAMEEYEKFFGKHTAIEFTNSDIHEEIISAKAAFLMEKGENLRAWAIMVPHIGNAHSIELLCNFALCLKKLGDNDTANAIYYKAINMYLQRPDIDDLKKYVGNYKQEDIDKTDERMKPIFEKVNAKYTLEEKQNQWEALRPLWDIHNFDFEKLCYEADAILHKLGKI